MSTAPGSLQIEVRLFAILRERAGTDHVTLLLPAGATVRHALDALREHQLLGPLLERLPVRLALNRDYAPAEAPLRTGDELALIPPLSGGDCSGEVARIHARVSSDPLRGEELRRQVSDAGAGAIVIFEGVTREVASLEYEAYTEMAAERLEAIAHECAEAHRLLAIAVEHRVGSVPLGEPSVIVAASSAHRLEAFAAAREAIDRIKAEAPIWKREVEADGSRRWVEGVPAPEVSVTPEEAPARLTHLDASGTARMVDVGAKPATERVARARARLRMSQRAAQAVQAGDGPKGAVLEVARIAGIQAGKEAWKLIPLAHPLALTLLDVSARVDVEEGLVELIGEARTVDRTGVEMEAMTACAVAALTVYDMVKGLERGIEVEQVVLIEKRGGRSGDYRRED